MSAQADNPCVRELLDGARVAAELASDDSDEQVIAALLRWIDEDRKVTPLKTLQGLIWADGYHSGGFKGHVYDDAARWLARWCERGLHLYVFSSGSVQAQRLLLAHSEHGDLTPLFRGYFDTRIGSKKEPAAYEAIAASEQIPARAGSSSPTSSPSWTRPPPPGCGPVSWCGLPSRPPEPTRPRRASTKSSSERRTGDCSHPDPVPQFLEWPSAWGWAAEPSAESARSWALASRGRPARAGSESRGNRIISTP